MSFYDEVKKLCKQQNTTVEAVLTEALGPGAVDMYYGRKRRHTLPRLEDVYKIAKVLGVSIDYLMDGDNSEHIPKRYKDICAQLNDFSDLELEQIKIMLKTMHETKIKM